MSINTSNQDTEPFIEVSSFQKLTRVVYILGVGKSVLFIEVSSTQRCGRYISTQVYVPRTLVKETKFSDVCRDLYILYKEGVQCVCGPGAARSSQRGL